MTTISKPDKASLTKALDHAEAIRERDNDPYHIGHALLYMAQRMEKLDVIASAAEEYIRFGSDAELHKKLVKALQNFESFEDEANLSDKPDFGLN